jgi:hypothetical protein
VSRDETSERVSDDGGALDGNSVEKRDGISGEFVDPVTGIQRFRVTEPSLIQDKRMNPMRQQRQNTAEREPRVRPPVQKEDRIAVSIALFRVVNLWTRRQSNSCESQVSHQPNSAF